jgi:hypothetical protein
VGERLFQQGDERTVDGTGGARVGTGEAERRPREEASVIKRPSVAGDVEDDLSEAIVTCPAQRVAQCELNICSHRAVGLVEQLEGAEGVS